MTRLKMVYWLGAASATRFGYGHVHHAMDADDPEKRTLCGQDASEYADLDMDPREGMHSAWFCQNCWSRAYRRGLMIPKE